MTSATDELRRMLDERGVEWTYGDGTVSFASDGHWCHAWASNDNTMCVSMGYFTPAQAVEATLGRGTCKPVISDNLTESEGTGDAWADCSECGHLLFVLTDPSSQPPNYCPNCGKRVDNG